MDGGVLATPRTDGPDPRSQRPGRLRDPRVWLGLTVTVAALWLALRGIDAGEVLAEFRRANWVLFLAIAVPANAAALLLRALRWRHLTDSIHPMPFGALYRATAIGFMANNVFPLRVGEFVRAYTLGREVGVKPAAIFGTVVLERVIDTFCVLGIALGVILFWGGETGVWRQGALWLAPLALVPLSALIAIRVAPERALAVADLLLRPLPSRLGGAIGAQLRGFASGLGALRGGSHLAWIALHSVGIWLVASTAPFLAAFAALDVDFGGVGPALAAGWMTLAAVGVAVAIPAAPGFFGVYHSACRLVLERFGISAETAVAIGTLSHAAFWVTITGLGLLALRSRHASLGDIDRIATSEELGS